jgi:hypothetical protein
LFKIYLLGITIVNFVVSYAVEKLLIPRITQKWNNRQFKKLRRRIEKKTVDYNLNQLHKIEKNKKMIELDVLTKKTNNK